MRAPTSRCSAAAASYVAAARAKRAAHRARIDVARIGRGEARLSRRQRSSPAPRRTRPDAKERRVRGAAQFPHSARPGMAAASQRPAAGGQQRVAAAGNYQRRLRDARRVVAQIGGREHARASSASAGRDGSPRAHNCSRSAASAARPCSLLCTCKARKRCTVSFQQRAVRRRSAPGFLRHRVRPIRAGDEARCRADQRNALHACRIDERPAHRDRSSKRPAEHGHRLRLVARTQPRRRNHRVERARRDRRTASVTGRSTAWTRW